MRKEIEPSKDQSANGFTKRKRLVLPIVTLIGIILILVVSTYAWVETVSTIRIYTGEGGSATQTGQIMTRNSQTASINPSAQNVIDISKMYHEAGDVHMAPASSSDGKNIIFPAAKGQTANYRAANSSDNMVNYVSFSFKVAQANYFVFNSDPTFEFVNENNEAVAVSDSLVRMSLAVDSNSPKIFSKATASGQVINNVDGTKGASTVVKYSDYLGGNSNYALHITANQILTIKIWIQDPEFTSSSTYLGKKLRISNLVLVPAYAFTAKVSLNGTEATDTSEGKVKVGSADEGHTSSAFYKFNDTVSITATDTNNESNNKFQFKGWSTDKNSTSYSSLSTTYTTTSNASNANNKVYYAIFRKTSKITATSVLNTAPGTQDSTGGTIKINTGTAGAHAEANLNSGTTATLTATAKQHYEFIGWYTSTSPTASSVSTSPTYTITVPDNDTNYYARFRIKTYTISVSADTTQNSNYGSVTNPMNYVLVGTGTPTATSSSGTVNALTNVTVKIKKEYSYFNFDGWYENGSCVSTDTTYTFQATSNRTLTAKFSQNTRTIYFQNASDWGGTVHAYFWEDSTGDKPIDWRGYTMTDSGWDNGHKYYSVTYWTKYDMVKFNTENGNQTGDLSIPSDKSKYHNYGDGGWY